LEPDEPPLLEPDDPPLFDADEPPLLDPDEPPLFDADEPPLLAPDDPPLFEPEEPPLLEADDPPLLEPDDPPLLEADAPPLLAPDDPPLFEPDEPPLLRDEADPPLFEPPDADEPPLRVDDEPPPEPLDFDPDERALLPLDRVLLLPPPLRVELELLFFPPVAARAAAAPSAAPAAAPAAVATGFLRRDVLRCSLSPRPALKPTVVRSGILISVPVRGLRPLRAARVRRVNFPNPGMDSDPAAWTASEMAPDAVSKIASTTRAAAALVSSAFSATASMNSDLFMLRSPDWRFTRRGPSAPRSPHANSVPPGFARHDQGSAGVLAGYGRLNPERNESTTFLAASAACPNVSLALSL
jgi:hypothetical protein